MLREAIRNSRYRIASSYDSQNDIMETVINLDIVFEKCYGFGESMDSPLGGVI